MLTKHNSAKRILAGAVLAVALGFAVSPPARVAAGNGHAEAGVSGVLATLQVAAGRALDGSVRMGRDLRSLYNVYQLQVAAVPVLAHTRAETEVVPRAMLCDLFTQAKPEPRKKCRT